MKTLTAAVLKDARNRCLQRKIDGLVHEIDVNSEQQRGWSVVELFRYKYAFLFSITWTMQLERGVGDRGRGGKRREN